MRVDFIYYIYDFEFDCNWLDFASILFSEIWFSFDLIYFDLIQFDVFWFRFDLI